MPTVTTREAARRDLVGYFVYLAENADLDTADRFLVNDEVSVNDLARHPKMGASLTLKNPGLADIRTWRIWGFDNHLVSYEPRPDGISIVRVLHAASDWWQLPGLEA